MVLTVPRTFFVSSFTLTWQLCENKTLLEGWSFVSFQPLRNVFTRLFWNIFWGGLIRSLDKDKVSHFFHIRGDYHLILYDESSFPHSPFWIILFCMNHPKCVLKKPSFGTKTCSFRFLFHSMRKHSLILSDFFWWSMFSWFLSYFYVILYCMIVSLSTSCKMMYVDWYLFCKFWQVPIRINLSWNRIFIVHHLLQCDLNMLSRDYTKYFRNVPGVFSECSPRYFRNVSQITF